MNLIEKLSMEAKESVPRGVLGVDKWIQSYNQKLCELIVRECIKIVEGYCETSPEIYGLPLEILEHFDMETGE